MAQISLFPELDPVELEGLALLHVTNISARLIEKPITIERTFLPLAGLSLLENGQVIDSAIWHLEDDYKFLIDTMDSREESRFEFECVVTRKRFALSATARARRIYVHAIDECDDEFERLQMSMDF